MHYANSNSGQEYDTTARLTAARTLIVQRRQTLYADAATTGQCDWPLVSVKWRDVTHIETTAGGATYVAIRHPIQPLEVQPIGSSLTACRQISSFPLHLSRLPSIISGPCIP